jgi:sugar-phosphatase
MSIRFDDVQAVLFDMDGTLIDSEQYTEGAALRLLAEHGIDDAGFDLTTLYGITWDAAAVRVKAAHPALNSVDVSTALQGHFSDLSEELGVSLVPGSDVFFAACAERFKVGLCTSNVRSEAERCLGHFPVFEALGAKVTSEDVPRSKPDPYGYLLVAEKLGVQAAHCVVFEDSIAGLQAARAAGMRCVAVTHRSPDLVKVTSLADAVIADYAHAVERFLS